MKHFKTLLATLLLLTAFVANAEPIPTTLWMVGSATPQDWKNGDANTSGKTKPEKTGDWYVYQWPDIYLKQGELKFFKDTADWAYCLVAENNNSKTLAVGADGKRKAKVVKGNYEYGNITNDNKWQIGSDLGECTITIRISETSTGEIRDMYLTIEPKKQPFTENYCARTLYAIGEAINGKGDAAFHTTKEMTFDKGHGTHTLSDVQLTAKEEGVDGSGRIRFCDGKGDPKSFPNLCPATNLESALAANSNEGIFNNHAFGVGDENNWTVPKTGKYDIVIQAPPYDEDFNGYNNYTVTFKYKPEETPNPDPTPDPEPTPDQPTEPEDTAKYTLFTVGGATQAGWTWSDTTTQLDYKKNNLYQKVMYLKGADGKNLPDINAKDACSMKFAFQKEWNKKELRAKSDWQSDSFNKPSAAVFSDAHGQDNGSSVSDFKWLIQKSGWYLVSVQMKAVETMNGGDEVAEVSFFPVVWQYGASVWPEGVNNNTTGAFDPTVYSKEVVCDVNGNYTGTFTVTSSSSSADHHTIRFAKFDKDMKLASWYSPVDAQENGVYHVKLTASVACEEIPNGAAGATDYYWSVPEDATGEFSYTFNPFNENGKNFSIKGIAGKYTVSSALYCNETMAIFTEGKEVIGGEAPWWTYTSKDSNGTETKVYYWQGHLSANMNDNKLFQLYKKAADGTKTYYIVKDQNLTNNDIYKMDISSEIKGAASLDITRPIGTNSEWIIPRENKFGVFTPTDINLTTTSDASQAHYFGLLNGTEGHYIMTVNDNDPNNIVLTARTYHRGDQDNDFQTAVEAVAGEGSLSVGRVGDTLWVSGANGGEVIVVSMTGARMASSAGAEAVEISMEGWPNGIYIVCGNGKAVKIVK